MAKEARNVPSVDNDYDPYANRDVEHPTNDLESLAHITKGILGTGVLAIPEGFGYAGGVMAVVYCLISGILCTVGMHILVKGFYMVCKAYKLPVVSYADAMKLGVNLGPECFAKTSRAFGFMVEFFTVFDQVGVLCVYMLFVTVTTQNVTNYMLEKHVPLAYYMLIMVIPFMLINSVKNLKLLAPVSYFSLAVTLMVIIMIFYYALREKLPDYTETRKYYNDFTKLPIFFGTTLYAFTSVAVVVSVENNMLNPKRFHMIYDIGITVLIVLYLSVGFFSYWRWGEELKPIVILNFPFEETAAKVGNYLYAVAIYLSLGLNGIVPVQLLMDTYILPKMESPHPVLWEYILRLGSIALGLFLAITVPFIGVVISLLGAVATSALTLIFPSLLDICWRHQKGYGVLKFRLIIDILMICYGVLGMTTGIYVNIRELYLAMSKED